MKIQILGTGCPKCKKLFDETESAVKSFGSGEIEKITDIKKIMEFNVLATPALAIDGKVAFAGKTASAAEILKLLQNAK